MSYIEDNLMAGERIIYRAKLHWAVFLWPAFWLVVAIMALGNGHDLGGFFMLVAILTGGNAFINFKTSEFGITDKRVIVKVGFIRRNSIEVLLSKVEGIQVKQGVVGRILGFGSIVVGGSGGTKNLFHKIDTPLELRRIAQEQIALVQDTKQI